MCNPINGCNGISAPSPAQNIIHSFHVPRGRLELPTSCED